MIVVGPGTLLGELALMTETHAAGDGDRARAVDGDPHFAQPVPEDARRLSATRRIMLREQIARARRAGDRAR